MENEAWDGTIENTVKITDAMGNDETIEEDEVFQTPCTIQCTFPSTPRTATQKIVQNNPVRTSNAQSTPRSHQTLARSPSSSTSPNKTL